MSVTDILKDQKRTLEAKASALREEIANVDVALKAIGDRAGAKPAATPMGLNGAVSGSANGANKPAAAAG